ENVYEMGSIIKPLVMAAALDAGAVSPQTTYTDHKGYVQVENATIRNFDGRGRGTVSMQEVLSQSLNTGMVFVEQQLGHERFRDYMRRFGVGEETGIDLPGETHGLVANLSSMRDVEYATASFGQGIALTPMETVRALAALGNGGTLIAPHLIDTIDYKGGLSRRPEYTDGEAVIGKTASEDITRMLVEVVDKALLGGSVKIPEYSVAAKTGTAQMAREDGKGYYDDRYFHSFFGYFPAYDPKFLVFLYTVNPKGATFASHTLTHPFIRLTKFLLNYYEIPPDREPGLSLTR
ncbi:MAG: penicillin-binding transpeptidase domain-containing protein, partial [bacterium]|nr:penicillin-binding transpeptidase domain-containing protein [bacterium]